MVDLAVNLCNGLKLQNPILTASGTFGYGDEVQSLVDVSRLGGLVTKSITREPREGHPPPRIAEMPAGMLNAIGLANVGVERFCEEKLPILETMDTAVLVSIAGSSLEEYREVLEMIEEHEPQIAGYEINASCPNVKKGGMEFGVSAPMTEKLTRSLREHTPRFLTVKLSPNVTDIGEIATAAQEGGADAISAINTVVGMGVDPQSGRFLLSTGLGGLSGPAIRPIALAAVYKVARAVQIPVIGIGGIMTVEDVVSFIRAGAHAVQVGTANFRDPGIGVQLASQLSTFASGLGLSRLSDLRNTAHP